jgi:cell division protein FtsZ
MEVSVIKIGVPNTQDLKPRIAVVGVGGAGGNAINNMIQSQLEGVDFIVANTDAQALAGSRTDRRIQLGVTITQGLGAGSRPDVGHAAAEEAMDQIVEHLQGSNMAFITAGMGGGTGTGAAPVIARAAREMGILTVGVVTKPFHFEGIHRMRLAEAGIQEMERVVDTLIIIPNQNLFRIANEKTTFADAFKMADDVLYSGVRGVTDLIVMPGLINLDFADIRAIMAEMGKAMMGTGEAGGERRALDAAEAAISNPLLDDTSMAGATGVLINITGGPDMTLFEVDEAANRIRSEVDPEAHIIFGSTFDDALEGKIRVSIVATGMDTAQAEKPEPQVLNVTDIRANAPEKRIRITPTMPPASRPAPVVPMRSSLATAEAIAHVEQPVEAPKAEVVAEEKPMVAPVLVAPAPAPTPVALAPVASAPELPAQRIEPTLTPRPAPSSLSSGLSSSGAFIPPAPAERISRPALQADPLNAAALLNGGKRPAPAPEAPAKRSPNLFERITGTGLASRLKAEPKAEAPVAKMEPVAPKAPLMAEPAPAPVMAAPALAPTPAPQPTPARLEEKIQPRLGGLDSADRAPAASPEEDLLDIPAFLRRQAN